MSAAVTREQAIAGARAVYDAALRRIAADYAAGRLSPEQALTVRRLMRAQHEQPTPRPLAA